MNEKINASLAILGGGKGLRMGGNKLFLANKQGGLIICDILNAIAHAFKEIIISVSADLSDEKLNSLYEATSKYDIKIARDKTPNIGPLEGLIRCLETARGEQIFLTGCDMPFVQAEVIRAMYKKDADATVCRINGYIEPLHAFYSKSCINEAKKALQEGKRHVKSFYDNIKLNIIEEEALSHITNYKKSFININSPEELIKNMIKI